MIAPAHPNEAERLAALSEYRILDTAPEEEFDDLVRLAANVCGVPIAAVSFIDDHRQWFKSILGVSVTELPRDVALCAHTILQSDLVIVQDAREDARFLDNPQVTSDPGVRFYAGAPLITEDGHALGTLCVADSSPRRLTPAQEEGLRLLVRLATSQLQATRRVAERERMVLNQERLVAEKESLVADRERAEADLAQSHAALAESNTRLQESEERLRRLTNAAFEGIAISQDGVLVDASPAFADLFGYDGPSQALGLLAKELAAPESRSTVAEKIDATNEEPYEAILLRRDGTTFQAELRGRMTQLGGRPARITVVRDITERNRQEEALRHSQARLAEAQRVARIGSWEYDIAADRITWSGELFRLFGMDPADGPPSIEGLMARLYPDDVPMHREVTAKAMADGLPYELDIRILRSDGSVRWTHAIGRGEANGTGRVTRLFGTLMDITERRLADERFRVLFEHSSDANMLFDEGGIIDCNPATVALLRCADKTQVLSLHPAVLSPEFQPDGRSSLDKSVEMDALAREHGSHRFEWVHRKMDGEEFPVEVTLTPVTLGDRPVMLVVWHDLTERKQAEEALRSSHERLCESEARLRLALESGGLGSYDMDQTTFQFLEVSDTYKAHFGLPPDARLSPDAAIGMLHPEDRAPVREAVDRAIVDGTTWQAEHRLVWPDGSVHWSRVHGLPIYDQAGRPVRMIGVTQDITERKALETERARLAEREHAIAAQLQAALQPPLPACVPRLAVAAYTCPALDEAEVGGDFYDCFMLRKDLYAILVGDVSGKGLAAAEQLALIRNGLRMALYLHRAPAEAVHSLNAIVTARDLIVGFVTAFVGVYDATTGRITYASCGHEPGLVRRACGLVEELGTTGPPLGMDGTASYGERTVTLAAGDSLLLHTDGLSESGPNRREMLGTEGMVRLLGKASENVTVQVHAEALVSEVKAIAGGVFRDDVTVLLMRRE